MTITVTAKNQITIPKKVASALGLHKGSLVDIQMCGNRIELIPLEVTEKVFTDEEYVKLEAISREGKVAEKKITPGFIVKLKTGKF